MLNSRYYILLPLALWLAVIAGTILGRNRTDAFLTACFSVPLLAAALPSRLIYQRGKFLGYAHYTACSASMFVLLIMSWFKPADLPTSIDREYVTVPFIIFSSISLGSLIIAVPGVVIPYFRRRGSHVTESAVGSLKVDFVTKGFDKIKESFGDVQKAVSRETSEIHTAIAEFQKNLQRQAEDLEKLQDTLRKTKEELEEYKSLASLSKKQRDAVLAVLSRHKYVDYIVGFILGMASSALVQWSPTILGFLLKK